MNGSSRIDGRVVLEAGAVLVDSTVRGPAIIGAGTTVVHSYIGPFTAVGARCEIVDRTILRSLGAE